MLPRTREPVLLRPRKTTNRRLLLGKSPSASHDSLEAATGPTSPACTMTGLSGTSPVTVAASETLCLTAPGSWAGSNLVVNGNLVVCGNGDFTFTGSGIVNGAYYRTSTTEVKVNGAGIFVNGGTTSIADSNC